MRRRVSIPGLAAEEFDGGSVGQAAAGQMRAEDTDDPQMVKMWRAGRTVRAGRGYRYEVEVDFEQAGYLADAFEALAIACEQGEERSAARACRIAAARLDELRNEEVARRR